MIVKMTAKKIALRIYDKFKQVPLTSDKAKVCALIAVEEIQLSIECMEDAEQFKVNSGNKQPFWDEVKNEINLF